MTCPPISMTTAAPRSRAARTRAAICRTCSAAGSSSGGAPRPLAGSMIERSRSCSRSASGRRRRRARSNAANGMRASLPKEPCYQWRPVAKVRHDHIGAGLEQPPALPLVDPFSPHLVRGYPHGDAAGLLHILDLDISIAKGHQLLAGKLVLLQDLVDHHCLR